MERGQNLRRAKRSSKRKRSRRACEGNTEPKGSVSVSATAYRLIRDILTAQGAGIGTCVHLHRSLRPFFRKSHNSQTRKTIRLWEI
jgi:hypothetical protein